MQKMFGLAYNIPCMGSNFAYLSGMGNNLENKMEEHQYAVKNTIRKWHFCTCRNSPTESIWDITDILEFRQPNMQTWLSLI